MNHEQVQQVLHGDKFHKYRRTNSNFNSINQNRNKVGHTQKPSQPTSFNKFMVN